MSATIPYRVKCLVAAEETIRVSAVTGSEARKMAESIPGVISVINVSEDGGQDGDIFREFDECLERLNNLLGDK